MPDEIAYTGQTIKDEKSDDIAKASDEDMNAYAVAISTGGAQQMIDALEPPPVKAEDDEGTIALLMEENLRSVGAEVKETTPAESIGATPDDDAEGAAFAANFSMEIKTK